MEEIDAQSVFCDISYLPALFSCRHRDARATFRGYSLGGL
jgi:hypothetical protein